MVPDIAIRPYRDAWRDDFQSLARALRPLVPATAVIHHIGSTAVPGLAAKDIIDIQVTVDALEQVDMDRLTTAGFRHIANRVDHVPPGQSLAIDDLSKLFFKGEKPASHVHVRARGRFNQRYALLWRDYLRAHPSASAAYERIKIELAARFPNDSDAYYAVKDPVCDLLMAGATVWADAVGWIEPPSDVAERDRRIYRSGR